MKMKIYVHGKDGQGWAIDENRKNLISAISRINFSITKNPVNADIFHNVWWNNIISPFYNKFFLKYHPKVIVTASNFINPTDPTFLLKKEFLFVAKYAEAWIAFSRRQKEILDQEGLNCFQLTNFVNIELFHPLDRYESKEWILKKYQIPHELFNNRIIIGSFQRDSLGSDLFRPKWQKGPELLLRLLEKLSPEKYVLLLAGPRRHFIINECHRRNIPYYYIGKKTSKDDVAFNTLSLNDIRNLYWLCDLYLVTSASESGPQAIMEAVLTKTPIFSTDVGVARDFLSEKQIFTSHDSYADAINTYLVNDDFQLEISNLTEQNYINGLFKLSYSNMDCQLKNIYRSLLIS